MAVAHDTSTRFPAGAATVLDTTTGDRTFSHAANASAKGAIVTICVDANEAPVTGVLYGGTAMSLVASANDTSEPARVVIYFLGDLTGLGGTQTVTLQGCTATGKYVDCSTVTAATSTTGLDNTGVVDTTTSSNPTVSFTTVANAMVYGAVVGGAAAPTSYAAGTGETAQQDGDFGANSSRTARSTAATSAGSYTFDFSYATSDDWAVAAISVKELVNPTTTSVARLSLGAANTPVTRTAHSIKVRARVTTTATATLRAALYEGATNRSGDLESSALTTSLADYTLAIPDASAANITSYADLELRLWGYSSTGATATVEVADVFLEIPASDTNRPLAGTAAGSSTVTGNLTGKAALAGVTAAASTVTGALTGKAALAGVAPAASTVTGALTVTTPLAGSIVGSSTLTGDASIAGGELALAGITVAASTVTGAVTVTTPLAGTAAAASTVSGDASAAKSLAGIVTASSTVSGAATVASELAGTIVGTSTVAGAVTVLGPLAGIITATSTVPTAALTNTPPGNIAESGTIVATSTVSGAATVTTPLAGAIAATATATAAVTVTAGLNGMAVAAATTTASLLVTAALAGTIDGGSTVTGDATTATAPMIVLVPTALTFDWTLA